MVVVRIALHIRNARDAMGLTGIGGLCKAAVAMLIESCALNAVSLLRLLEKRPPDIPWFISS